MLAMAKVVPFGIAKARQVAKARLHRIPKVPQPKAKARQVSMAKAKAVGMLVRMHWGKLVASLSRVAFHPSNHRIGVREGRRGFAKRRSSMAWTWTTIALWKRSKMQK